MNMGAHMKTTLELNDALLREAKAVAARERRTLRDVTEVALRRYLDELRVKPSKSFRLARASFRGRGLQPGMREGDWAAIRDKAYEGRGG
jgi:hypothetical protein